MTSYQDTLEKLAQTEKLLEESRQNFVTECRSHNRDFAKLENARVEIFELKKIMADVMKILELISGMDNAADIEKAIKLLKTKITTDDKQVLNGV